MRKISILILLAAGACEKREVPPPVVAMPPPAVVAAPPPAAVAAPATAPAVSPAPAFAAGDPLNGVRVQVPVDGDNFSQPRLGFTITRVYENQKPTDAAPFHAAGGDWLFFDAETIAAAPAGFTVGVNAGKPAAADPFSFGRVVMVAADRAAGARFVTQLAGHFHVADAPAGAERPLAPFKFSLSAFGHDLAELPGGGYGGGRGHWNPTKLFPAAGGHESEVFFNYNLVDKRGEFAEKDSAYRKDLVAVLALGLRDGLPAPAKK